MEEVVPQVQSDDTDAEVLSMLKVMLPPKIGKNQDVHTGQQVGEPRQHLGAGLPGEGLGHDEGRSAHPLDAR